MEEVHLLPQIDLPKSNSISNHSTPKTIEKSPSTLINHSKSKSKSNKSIKSNSSEILNNKVESKTPSLSKTSRNEDHSIYIVIYRRKY